MCYTVWARAAIAEDEGAQVCLPHFELSGGSEGILYQGRDEAGVGQSGKAFWKSWNVRHLLSNRRVRGPGSIAGRQTRWTAWRRLLKDGEAQCQWARALKVLFGKNGCSRVA